MRKTAIHWAALLCLGACAVDVGETFEDLPLMFSSSSDSDGAGERKLFALSHTLYPSVRHARRVPISVCWESGGTAEERGWVRSAVEASWEANTDIDFTGWGSCGSGSIRIRGSDRSRVMGGLGREVRYMELNLRFTSNREANIKDDAMHEFGHAIGLAHEANHPNSTCPDAADTYGNIWWNYDPNSIMNYCANDPLSMISTGDIAAIKHLYGTHVTNSNQPYAVYNTAHWLPLALYKNPKGGGWQVRLTTGGSWGDGLRVVRTAGSGQIQYGDQVYLRNDDNQYIQAFKYAKGPMAIRANTGSGTAWKIGRTDGSYGGTTVDIRDPFTLSTTLNGSTVYLNAPDTQSYAGAVDVSLSRGPSNEWRLLGPVQGSY